MKAAVMYQKSELPQYVEVPEPLAQNGDEIVVSVKAAAIKHLDRGRASGKHYSTGDSKETSRVIGGDGVCLLPDGSRVYAMGVSGMLAEKATIHKDRIVHIPEALDDATAAALPNAVAGAAMALKFKADIQPGDVVLVNGATGVTGRIAVQIAKHYGAGKVIVTGRNPESLQELLSLGADEIVAITQDDASFQAQVAAIHADTPIDIVVDYLWGHSAEMILACIKGDGSFTNRIRYVSVGAMSGDLIQLSAAIIRSLNLQITGSGLGAWTKAQVGQFFSEILPEMFQLAAEGKLTVNTETVKLADIGELWHMDVPDGKRLVVEI